jgi:[acyl-carrier-protein] S-malonyltransferase
MAAVLGLADNIVEEVCASIDGSWLPLITCPGVISGEMVAVEKACEAMKRREQNAL